MSHWNTQLRRQKTTCATVPWHHLAQIQKVKRPIPVPQEKVQVRRGYRSRCPEAKDRDWSGILLLSWLSQCAREVPRLHRPVNSPPRDKARIPGGSLTSKQALSG
jgi:hypothetical protein